MVLKTLTAFLFWITFSSASVAVTPTAFGQLVQVCSDPSASVDILSTRFRDLGWRNITTEEYELYKLVKIDTSLLEWASMHFDLSSEAGSLASLKRDRSSWLENVGERKLADEPSDIEFLVHQNEPNTFLSIGVHADPEKRGKARTCILISNDDELALSMLRSMTHEADISPRGLAYVRKTTYDLVGYTQDQEPARILFRVFDRVQVESAIGKKLNGSVIINFLTPASLIEVTP